MKGRNLAATIVYSLTLDAILISSTYDFYADTISFSDGNTATDLFTNFYFGSYF